MWYCVNCQRCYAESACALYKNDYVYLLGGAEWVGKGNTPCECEKFLVHYDSFEAFKQGQLSDNQFKNLSRDARRRATELHRAREEAEQKRKPTERELREAEERAEREQVAREKERLIHQQRVQHLTVAVNRPLASPLAGPLSYADRQCGMCNNLGGHPLSESWETRWYAKWIHGYLRNIYGISTAQAFMVGVAIHGANNTLVIAFSGSFLSPERILEHVTFNGFTLHYCPEEAVKFKKNISGKNITEAIREEAVTVVGKEEELDADVRDTRHCAASKIIVRHIVPFGTAVGWNMTELVYGNIKGVKYIDGEPAESCPGCKVMLPCLLCTKR